LESHAARRYHAGLPNVRRSTLAEANAQRPAAVFSGLFAAMVATLDRKSRKQIGESVYLIDSTSIRLNELSEWSRFSKHLSGVKAHIVYDASSDRPTYFTVTPARVNDITAAWKMPIDPGATYVFDLGYYHFKYWATLDEAGCRFITRLKSNTPLRLVKTLEVPKGTNILSDRIGFLPDRLSGTRENPVRNAVREIRVRLDTGKEIRIVSNDLDAPAAEIAALYKRRWGIELFFRWVKQTLKIGHFFGTSENAVRIQIAVALITFLLIKLAHASQTAIVELTRFARLLSANIMHRRPLERLRQTGNGAADEPVRNTRQMALLWG
jgi:predicted HTH domain antitoxin